MIKNIVFLLALAIGYNAKAKEFNFYCGSKKSRDSHVCVGIREEAVSTNLPNDSGIDVSSIIADDNNTFLELKAPKVFLANLNQENIAVDLPESSVENVDDSLNGESILEDKLNFLGEEENSELNEFFKNPVFKDEPLIILAFTEQDGGKPPKLL